MFFSSLSVLREYHNGCLLYAYYGTWCPSLCTQLYFMLNWPDFKYVHFFHSSPSTWHKDAENSLKAYENITFLEKRCITPTPHVRCRSVPKYLTTNSPPVDQSMTFLRSYLTGIARFCFSHTDVRYSFEGALTPSNQPCSVFLRPYRGRYPVR